jgi:hypothetical protein
MGRLSPHTTEQTPFAAFALEATQLTASSFVGLSEGKKCVGMPGRTVIGTVSVNLRSRYTHVDPYRDRVAGGAAKNADVALSNPRITALQPLADFADTGLQGTRTLETAECDIQHGCPYGFSQK